MQNTECGKQQIVMFILHHHSQNGLWSDKMTSLFWVPKKQWIYIRTPKRTPNKTLRDLSLPVPGFIDSRATLNLHTQAVPLFPSFSSFAKASAEDSTAFIQNHQVSLSRYLDDLFKDQPMNLRTGSGQVRCLFFGSEVGTKVCTLKHAGWIVPTLDNLYSLIYFFLRILTYYDYYDAWYVSTDFCIHCFCECLPAVQKITHSHCFEGLQSLSMLA